MIEKIISGGQTGVDQAGFLVATEMGIPIGGWCPLSGKDENGHSIFEKYPSYLFNEVQGLSFEESVAARTKLNVEQSDATLIIVPGNIPPEEIPDGTMLTITHAKKLDKPYLLIAVSEPDATKKIKDWIEEKQVRQLNIAGPRESSCPGIHDKACELFRSFFPYLKLRPRL
jgi:Circularly permutated YpsA SLOG family